jgi:hypothetical protein
MMRLRRDGGRVARKGHARNAVNTLFQKLEGKRSLEKLRFR